MRRHLSRIPMVVAIAALALAGLATTAGAGSQMLAAPLTIAKTVHGTVPAGTTFTVTIHCGSPIIDDGGSGTDTATVTFDAQGNPTSADTIGFGDPGQCTVTETADGGAATVTYSCVGTLPSDGGKGTDVSPSGLEPVSVCATDGPQADPIVVNIISGSQTATVTVDNTFVEPAPTPGAGLVQQQPTFPG
jgi:Domain of unknown function (DUF5979)